MKTSTMKSLVRGILLSGAMVLMSISGSVSGQSCNLPSISSPTTVGYAARAVTFSNLSLNSGGNTAQVNPGSTVSISFNWSSAQGGSYCPGCVVQLYVGINGAFTQCLTSGFGGYTASGSQNFSFTAPTTPGIYYITLGGTLHFSCQNVGTPQCGNTIGAIRVGNPVQTASASISGNSSFCPGSTAALSASVTGIFCTPSSLSYQWYFGGDPYTLGTAITGATASTYNASAQGNYRVVVTNACGGSATSGPYFVSADNVAPTVNAKDITVYLDANGAASINAGMINDGSSDNCGITSYSINKSSFNCSNSNNPTNGVLSGKMTADNEFVAYISTSASSLGTQIGSGTDWAVTYTLNNSILSIGQDYYLHVKATDVGSIEGLLGTLNVTGSFVFANGQQTMNTNPSYWTAYNTFGGSAITPVALGSNGMSPWGTRSGIASNAQWIWRDPRNTSGGEVVYFTTKISYNPGTNDVILTAFDANGNSSFDISHVTVLDNMNPTVVTKNITVNLDANGNASINAGMINDGSYDNCGIASYSISKSNFNCGDVGNNTVTLSVTDVYGNVGTGTATVTVVDNIAPNAVAQNVTIYLDANGNATTTAGAVNSGSTDNCGISSLSLSKTSFNCSNVGNNNVVLTVTDNNNNSSTANAVVTVVNNIGPNAVAQNVTIYLDANGAATTTASAVNNGSSSNCGIASMSLSKTSFSCGDVGNNAVTLTVTDNNNNSSTATAVVTVVDNISPTVSTKTANMDLDGNGTITVQLSDVHNGSSDNCGLANVYVSKSASSNVTPTFNCSETGNQTVYVVAVDNNNNTTVQAASIVVRDANDPVATAQDITVYVDANGSATISASDINNGSTDNCGITSMTIDKTTFGCSNVSYNNNGVLSGIVSADNEFTAYISTSPTTLGTQLATGNNWANSTSFGNQTLTTGQDYYLHVKVTDYGLVEMFIGAFYVTGSFEFENGTQTLYTGANNWTMAASLGGSTETIQELGANGVSPWGYRTGIPSNAKHIWNNNYGTTGGETRYFTAKIKYVTVQNAVTLTVEDAAGNYASDIANVTVLDNIAPTVNTQNVTIYLDANGNATTTAAAVNDGSTDNCGIASYSLSKTNFNCSDVGNNTVTLTVTDESGNSSTGNATVTVVDNTAPNASAQNVTIYLDANGNASTTAAAVNNGSSDNCGVASISLSQTDFDCGDVGANTVTLTVTDVNGNQSTANATVTVVDNINPSATAQNVTIYLDANGAASTTAAAVNNGSSDNCGVASVTLSQTNFDCSEVGNNTVTLTVTDVNGNQSTTTATVTVVDAINPTVQTQNITIYLNANGAASTTAGAVDNGSYDNCGVASISLSQTSFDCSEVGNNTVTLTVNDVNGNSSTGTATVTVVDAIAPTVLTKNVSVTLSGGAASITANDVNDGSYDNCGVSTTSVSPSSWNCGDIGNHTVTLTVTDVNGNTATNTATVSVLGYVPSCSLTATPSNNTYTGAAQNQMFIGYGPQSMNLTCAATGGTGFSYSWSGSYLSSTTGSTNVFTPTAGGNYTVYCTVTNSNGCETTCSITICVLDIRSNNNPNKQKVYLCHSPNGNPNNVQTLSISVNAVPSHLGNHSGDKLGQCNQSCGSQKNEQVGEMYIVDDVELIVFPNPSNGVFKFTLESESDESVEIKIYDATGKLVMTKTGGHAFEEIHVDATTLAPGIYNAVVSQGQFIQTVKLTKTN